MGGDERAKPKVPLDEEWVALARKMLKGADPEERLTWRTPEVCGGEGVVPLPLSGYYSSNPFRYMPTYIDPDTTLCKQVEN